MPVNTLPVMMLPAWLIEAKAPLPEAKPSPIAITAEVNPAKAPAFNAVPRN